MVKTYEQIEQTTIILTPNRSASWAESKILLMVVGTFVMLIATVWSLAGAWLVLPFAGIEIALLSLLMYVVNRKTYQKQVITLARSGIKVEYGVELPTQTYEFEFRDTHLKVIEAEHSMDKARLTLSDNKTSLEIGAFLNQQDCCSVRHVLKQAGLMECNNKWWKTH